MQEVTIDGKNCNTANDFYDAFFKAVGAPAWHGRNFNALRDSICQGKINKIEVPYVLRIKNWSAIGDEARSLAIDFVELIKELRDSGCAVGIVVEQ